MDAPLEITLQIVLAVIAGITAQALAEYLKIPGIVLLMLFGILLGHDGLGWINPNQLGDGLEVIVSLSVAVILFEGGLSLELRDLGRVSGSLRNLVTLGTLITLIGGGVAAHWLSEFPWPIAFLYASLVVVTGPTVITPLLKQVQVDRRVAALLEGEGVLIDPVGAILAVVVLNIILSGDTDLLSIISSLGIRLGIGAAIGGIGGWLIGLFLKRAEFLSEELKNLVVLAGVWGLYGLSQVLRSESGLMAAVVAGIVIGSSAVPEHRGIRRFKGQLTILAISFLFILLAADLSIASIFALGWGGALTVFALMFIVRPINITLCTWQSGMNFRQKFFMAWISPRGIISASVASLFSILLTERGVTGGESIKALVFLTITLTVVIQGLTARWVAELLRVTSEQATGALIVGCNPMSILVARLFKERNEPVVLIDTNPDASNLAEQEGLPVIVSSGLDAEILERAGLPSLGTFLAMTNNGEVNLVLAQRALEEFQPPRVFAVFPKTPQPNKGGSGAKVRQAFAPQLPIKTWSQFIVDDAVRLGETRFKAETLTLQQQHIESLVEAGKLVPLVIERQDHLQIAPAASEWQADDRLIYLFHDTRSKLVKLLAGKSKARLSLEQLPEVEDLPTPMTDLPSKVAEKSPNGAGSPSKPEPVVAQSLATQNSSSAASSALGESSTLEKPNTPPDTATRLSSANAAIADPAQDASQNHDPAV